MRYEPDESDRRYLPLLPVIGLILLGLGIWSVTQNLVVTAVGSFLSAAVCFGVAVFVYRRLRAR